MQTTTKVQPAKVSKRYFTTRDVAVIAIFSVLQWFLQHNGAAFLNFLPGAERPVVALPVGFLAAVTYMLTRKSGAVGITMLITGLIQFMLGGFTPVLFEFTGGAIGAELVVAGGTAWHHRPLGKLGIGLMGGALMLGRGIGVTTGLLIFVPTSVLKQTATQALLLVYLAFNGVFPFVTGIIGGLIAVGIVAAGRMGHTVPKPQLESKPTA